MQPPSRGCVLKPKSVKASMGRVAAAAFARLCVETKNGEIRAAIDKAAAFARLCVETYQIYFINYKSLAAAFARLCVETCFLR